MRPSRTRMTDEHAMRAYKSPQLAVRPFSPPQARTAGDLSTISGRLLFGGYRVHTMRTRRPQDPWGPSEIAALNDQEG